MAACMHYTFDVLVGESRLPGTVERDVRPWSTLEVEWYQEEVGFWPTI